MSGLILRVFIAFGFALLGVSVYRLFNRVLLKRAARKVLGLDGFHPGQPAVLYFTMEGCIPCQTTQRPALALLKEMTGGSVQVIEVDVVAQAELAERWGVLSVPTTFIIDPVGQPRRVNHGVTLADRLMAQLEQVSGKSLLAGLGQVHPENIIPDTGMD